MHDAFTNGRKRLQRRDVFLAPSLSAQFEPHATHQMTLRAN